MWLVICSCVIARSHIIFRPLINFVTGSRFLLESGLVSRTYDLCFRDLEYSIMFEFFQYYFYYLIFWIRSLFRKKRSTPNLRAWSRTTNKNDWDSEKLDKKVRFFIDVFLWNCIMGNHFRSVTLFKARVKRETISISNSIRVKTKRRFR